MIEMPTIVVTGASGLLGSRLVRALSSDANVIGLDIKPSQHGEVDIRQVDLLDRKAVRQFLESVEAPEIDAVVHLAAIARIEQVRSDISAGIRTNIEATANLVEACCLAGVKRILHGSTGGVYGTAGGKNPDENASVGPADLYASTKLAAELIGSQIAESYGVRLTIARIFRVIGEGLAPEIAGDPFTEFFGANSAIARGAVRFRAEQPFEFCHADDVAKMLRLLAIAKYPRHSVYNLGMNHAPTVAQLCSSLSDVRGSKQAVSFGNEVIDNRPEMLDSTRFHHEFQPELGGYMEKLVGYGKWCLSCGS